MGKIKILLLGLLLGVLVIVAVFFAVGYFKPSKAGLLIETEPVSLVFINEEQMGRTRYESALKPGEIVLKLVPESKDIPLPPYEIKIKLESGVKTIVQRSFSVSDEESSGAIVSFERTGEAQSSLSVISIPDASQVLVDSQVRGTTPLKISNIPSGVHKLSVELTDYNEKAIDINTYDGFKLTAVVKLSRKSGQQDTNPQPSALPTPEPTQKKVLISDTTTGFLRVRVEPSTLANEVGQVKPDNEYLLLDTDDETGWYKIEFEDSDGKRLEGWISNQYAEVLSDSSTSSPGPTGEN